MLLETIYVLCKPFSLHDLFLIPTSPLLPFFAIYLLEPLQTRGKTYLCCLLLLLVESTGI